VSVGIIMNVKLCCFRCRQLDSRGDVHIMTKEYGTVHELGSLIQEIDIDTESTR